MKTRLIVMVVLLLALGCAAARAQESVEPDIQKRLDLIKRGNVDLVRSELPTLMARYPNNPGLLYLQGVLTVDGSIAVRIFQNVADNFPKSEWADDALYKTYQYYYALGLYQTADQKLERLKRDYPQSAYLKSLQQQASIPPAARAETPAQAAARPEPQRQQVGVAPQPVIEKKEAPVVEKKETPVVVKKETAPAAPAPSASGKYTVQTGVFSSRQNAEKFQQDLTQAGFSADIRPRDVGGREMYRVCIGSYASYEEAQRQVETLKGKNITGIVTGW